VVDAVTRLLDRLIKIGDDFSGTDLRTARLDHAHLEGIRWTTDTLWPDTWEIRIRDMSVEIAPGVFEVTGDQKERSEMPQFST
jgi:hypothetical protein